ncbi:MAG TPA: hypothetical protein VGW40_04265 [Allosphingosinicella sp.]|nr:hypothetical protein [Allosphingosinicella sp.]
MRLLLIAAASTLLAAPAAAQPPRGAPPPRPSDEIRSYAPAVDRAADAFLDIDLGPLLDAVDPYRRHGPRTLRDMARRDDPDFDRRLRASIYGNAAAMGRVADAIAAAQPALRHAADQIERGMADAIDAAEAPPPPDEDYAAPPPPPPGDVDDDWDQDVDDEPQGEPEPN